MKVLLTNTGPWGTGSFVVANAVLKELISRGHQAKLFFPDAGLFSPDRDEYYHHPELYEIWRFPVKHNQIEIPSFPLMIRDPNPRNPSGNTFRDLSKAQFELYFTVLKRELQKVVNAFQPDIVECQHLWSMDSMIREMGLPYICTAHNSDQMGFQYDKRMQAVIKPSAQDSSFVFAFTPSQKEQLVTLYDIAPEKIILMNNGFDQHIFYSQPVNRKRLLKQLGIDLPEDAFVASFAGKLSLTKGIDTLLEASQLLHAKSNVHFLILGSGQLSEVVKDQSKLDFNRLHFLGHQPPDVVAKIHNISHINVAPSRQEGFSLSVLEAMACGLPVLMTPCGGTEKVISGKVIEPESPQALAEAIMAYANMTVVEYKNESKKAVRTAQKYTWNATVTKRLKYYRMAIK